MRISEIRFRSNVFLSKDSDCMFTFFCLDIRYNATLHSITVELVALNFKISAFVIFSPAEAGLVLTLFLNLS